MTRWISVGLITLTLGASESSDAARRASPFPLADGNRWTLRDVKMDAAPTIAVRRGYAGFVLSGLPGMPDVRVRWSGRRCRRGIAGIAAGKPSSGSGPRGARRTRSLLVTRRCGVA